MCCCTTACRARRGGGGWGDGVVGTGVGVGSGHRPAPSRPIASRNPLTPCTHPFSCACQAYNIGTQHERSVMDVARDVAAIFGLPPSRIEHVRDRAFNDRRYFICDAKLAAVREGASPRDCTLCTALTGQSRYLNEWRVPYCRKHRFLGRPGEQTTGKL